MQFLSSRITQEKQGLSHQVAEWAESIYIMIHYQLKVKSLLKLRVTQLLS